MESTMGHMAADAKLAGLVKEALATHMGHMLGHIPSESIIEISNFLSNCGVGLTAQVVPGPFAPSGVFAASMLTEAASIVEGVRNATHGDKEWSSWPSPISGMSIWTPEKAPARLPRLI